MKKALFIVALYLVPFLSVKADIFSDGSVDVEPIKISAGWSITCTTQFGAFSAGGEGNYTSEFGKDACRKILRPLAESDFNANHQCPFNYSNQISVVSEDESSGIKWDRLCQSDGGSKKRIIQDYSFSLSNLQEVFHRLCPPDSVGGKDLTRYTYGHDNDGDGEKDVCANPEQISQVDSCNATSGNEYLTIDVSAPSGCFPQADGSICKYDGVDVGGGNQYYALDLEGDCYSNPDGLPDLNGTPKDNPVGDNCVDYGGGVLGCPEDPSNVCSSSGSSFAGGSINNCQTGCGMVNDQFLCIDNDTDGDGLPDYNDPDIDGDGIPNDDDLDSDGDGSDDPIHGGNGSGGAAIDLGPVVDELKKLNKQFESQGKPDDIDKDDKLSKKNDDYKNDLEELRDKSAEEMGYVDVLQLDSGAGLVNASVPESSCRNFAFHPAGQTITIDTCVVSDKVRPFLTWLFGILTAWHIFFLINKTLREGV